MAEWRELRESFREALVRAFNQETLAMALMDCCVRSPLYFEADLCLFSQC
jgi:hypothetical protein